MIGKWTGPDGVEREIKLNPMNEKRMIILTGFEIDLLAGLLAQKMNQIIISQNLETPNDEVRELNKLQSKLMEGHFDFGVDLEEYEKEMRELMGEDGFEL